LRSIGINDYINSVTVYTPNKMKKAGKKMAYGSGMKKMMTGGMKNANASVVVGAPESKGVITNMNPGATVVPGGQPSRMYGGKMKKGGAMMKKMGKKK
jgi:hypothetical protein